MGTVLETQTRHISLSKLPDGIDHWGENAPARLDRTLLALFLRKPIEREAMEHLLEKTGLRLVLAPRPGVSLLRKDVKPKQKEDRFLVPQDTPLLNESLLQYFVESEDGKAIMDEQLDRLDKKPGMLIESFGPIYRLGSDDQGRKRFDRRFSPSPRSLLVELKDGVGPDRLEAMLKQENLEVERNFPKSSLLYLRFVGHPEDTIYRLKSTLANQYRALIKAAHFENVPMLNPQQGNQWNHQQIQANALPVPGSPDVPTPIAIIDRGIQFNNQFSAIPSAIANGGSWNAGTLAIDYTFPVSEYHGTCCAGIISEVSKTFAVVSKPAEHKILSIIAPNFSDAQIAAAINYAVGSGYKVISMSLNEVNSVWNPAIISPALDYAFSQDCIVCMSSGNDNRSTLPYPASYAAVTAVGATNHDDSRVSLPAWGSNYGANLSVCAPGVDIPTTDLNGIPGISKYTGVSGAFTMAFSGTSAATPHVAAVAAMIISKCIRLNIRFTAANVRERIRRKADKVTPGNPYAGSGSAAISATHGYGRLNAAQALNFNDASTYTTY